jgi:hypothetical protein
MTQTLSYMKIMLDNNILKEFHLSKDNKQEASTTGLLGTRWHLLSGVGRFVQYVDIYAC